MSKLYLLLVLGVLFLAACSGGSDAETLPEAALTAIQRAILMVYSNYSGEFELRDVKAVDPGPGADERYCVIASLPEGRDFAILLTRINSRWSSVPIGVPPIDRASNSNTESWINAGCND